MSTYQERCERTALGEFAIGLFERLGISPERLDELSKAPDPLAALQEATGNREASDVHVSGSGESA